MKRLAFAAVLILFVTSLSMAADFPKVEVFGGYSVLRVDTGIDDASALDGFSLPDIGDVTISNFATSKFLKKGFNASLTYNATSMLGIEAGFRYNTDDIVNFDVDILNVGTGSAAIKMKDFAFGVGPKLTFRNSSPITPFAHALFGFDKAKLNANVAATGQSADVEIVNDNGFGLTLGGGFDVKVNNNFAIRLIQADYYMTRHYQESQNNFALSFGVVIGFGK